jgi:hypothetical protein
MSFLTRFKLTAGFIILIMGIFYTLFADTMTGIILLAFGNFLHLDGRVSKLEELDEMRTKDEKLL